MSVTGNAGSEPAVENYSQKSSLWAPPFLNLVHSVSDFQEPRAELDCFFWDAGRLWSKHCAFGLCLDLWCVVGVVKLWVQLSVVFFFCRGGWKNALRTELRERERMSKSRKGRLREKYYILATDWKWKKVLAAFLKALDLLLDPGSLSTKTTTQIFSASPLLFCSNFKSKQGTAVMLENFVM